MSKTLQDVLEALEEMVWQFGGHGTKDGVPVLHTQGLSALEYAFEVLGWEDPHPCPESACVVDGCKEWATCGIPTPDGYKCVCGKHYRDISAGLDEFRWTKEAVE